MARERESRGKHPVEGEVEGGGRQEKLNITLSLEPVCSLKTNATECDF
jgi:hypothetical protein